MSDAVDQANELAVRYVDIQLANRCLAVEPSEECEECGITIPDARQEATGGTTTCIGCAELNEIRGR